MFLLACGIGLQETVDGFRLIDLACIKNALWEIRKMDAVREILRLEAERTAGTVMSTLLPGLRRKKVGGIELYAGEIRGDLHAASAARVLDKGDSLQVPKTRTSDETVVVPRGKAQLIPICVNRIPNASSGAEVHRGSVHRENPSRGETPSGDLQKAAAVQRDPVAENASRVMSGEIEEAVVGEVDQCFSIADPLKADVETVFIIQGVEYTDLQISGEAGLAIRAGPEEADTVREQLGVPELLMKAGFEVRVQVAAVVVVGQAVFDSVQREGRTGDAVGMAADSGAEEAACLILRQRIVAGNHVPGQAVGAGNQKTHEDGAVICHLGTHAAAVPDGKEGCMFARAGDTEISLLNQHGRSSFSF